MKLNRVGRCMREFARDAMIGFAVFAAVIVLAIFDSRAAGPAPALGPATPASVTDNSPDWTSALSPERVTSGTLVVRKWIGNGAENEPAAIPATRLDTNVDVTVSGPIARTTITQRFRNPNDSWAEGVYAYPLPGSSTVDTLSMRIGKRVVKSEIIPRAKAQELYAAAKRTGQNITPLIKPEANIFMASVAKIAPGEEITVKFEYQELLRGDGGKYFLRVPLVVAPRHAPRSYLHPVKLDGHAGVSDGNRSEKKDAHGVPNEVSLRIRINSGFPLGAVESDNHEIALRRTGEATAIVTLHQGNVASDRDFQLSWETKRASSVLSTAFHQKLGADDYLLTMLEPPKAKAAPAPVPREVVFVVDTSISVAGEAFDQVRESLTLSLKRLRPGDRFNIIGFNSSNMQLFQEPMAVTDESVGIATDFVARLQAGGETLMLPALEAALADPRSKDTDRVRQVVLLTGGAVSSDSTFLSTLAQKRGRSRVFIIGLGSVPNEFLMRRAAEIGRGSFIDIRSQSDVSTHLNAFFQRLERPVVTDLKLEWAAGVRVDSWPNPLPDLYLDDPLILTARVSALKGEMRISGKIAGRKWSRKIALTDSRIGTGIGKFWARHKVASLEARSYTGQAASDVNEAIEAVALAHGLVGRTTSLIAIDVTPPRAEDQPIASESLPLDLPAGWIYDKDASPTLADAAHAPAAETPAPNSTADAAPHLLQLAASPTLDKPASKKSMATQRGLQVAGTAGTNKLTQGSSASESARDDPDDHVWILAAMAVIFSLMSGLTLGLWRHLRRAVDPARGRRRENQAF